MAARVKALSAEEIFRANVAYYLEVEGLTVEQVADAWGCSISTAYRRIRLPGTVTLEMIRVLAKLIGVSPDRLIAERSGDGGRS